MSSKWNSQQLKAIEARNRNILVSASAGSGKTGVLVQRLCELVLKDHIQINEILAMTFTEDAANEMKKRLSKQITALMNEETDEKQKAFLKKQLSLLSDAAISTIHSFCLSILKEFYYVIDFSMKRVENILTQDEALYKEKAAEAVIQKQLQSQNEAFIQLNYLLNENPANTQDIKDVIILTAEAANSHAQPKEWLQQALAEYQNVNMSAHPTASYTMFLQYYQTQIQMYMETLEAMMKSYNEHAIKEKHMEQLFYKQEQAKELLTADKNADELRKNIVFLSKLKLDKPADDTCAQLRSNLFAIEDELLGIPPMEEMIKDLKEIAPLAEKLIECASDFLDEYEKIKCENECIDFSDMEHYALKILKKNNHEVAKIYQKRFKQIMVDEFQDSNDVQDELVRLICRKDNVFRVGDVKQSIYRFRHAMPSIMQNYKVLNDEVNECIIFNRNYRSSETLVEFNNVLFEILMNIPGFNSLPFGKEDRVEIGTDAQKKVQKPVIFHALNPELKSYENEKIRKYDYKARYIAYMIEKIHKEGKYDYKDMAVLASGNSTLAQIRDVLKEYNIPTYVKSRSGFFTNPAIQILLCTLRSLVNPQNDIDFVGMLTSPFFNFTSTQLAQIADQKEKSQSYYDYLKQTDSELLTSFEELRKLERISDIITQCFCWNQFYDRACSNADKTNLDLFFDKAVQYESTKSSRLDSFLDAVEGWSETDSEEASSIGKGDNVVRLMTIHGSKGLEFPVVFLWCSSSNKNQDIGPKVIFDNQLGIGMKILKTPSRYVRNTLPRIAIEYKQNREDLEESIRVLYVATTRAKDEMHCVDFVNLDAISTPINTTVLNSRKGSTSQIIQALINKNVPHLFQIHPVNELWVNTYASSVQTNSAQFLPDYTAEQPLNLYSPTTAAAIACKPLDLSTPIRNNYGNEFHKMIEKLPVSAWNDKMIEDQAKKLNCPNIHWLKKDLMALQSNEVFLQCQKGQIIHEYPFAVQKEQEILTGSMDMISILKDCLILIDFKTDWAEEEELIRRHAHQLKDYIYALSVLYPNIPIQAYIYSTHLKKMIAVN